MAITRRRTKTFDRFFDYFLEEYGANEAFDVYNTFRIREGKVASILLLFDSAPWRSLFEEKGR